MVGDIHKDRLEFAKSYFEKKGYRQVSVTNLSTTINKYSEIKSGLRPDLLMLRHNFQNSKLETGIQLPRWIRVIWVEIVSTNFQKFPTTNVLIQSLYHTLRWKDFYDKEILQGSPLGSKVKTEQVLCEFLKKNSSRIYIEFYLVQKNSFWLCMQVDNVPMKINEYF